MDIFGSGATLRVITIHGNEQVRLWDFENQEKETKPLIYNRSTISAFNWPFYAYEVDGRHVIIKDVTTPDTNYVVQLKSC